MYTLLQKKGNFKNVAFLLEKSVSDPGAPGKLDRLNLRFFWRRMYMKKFDQVKKPG